MFQDEGRFGLLGTPHRCWAPRHVRPVVGARLQRKYLYAFAAVSPNDGALDSLILPWVNAQTMSLLFLPPYSPELNPAEHLWETLREDWFANTVFHNLDDVEEALHDGSAALEADPRRVQSMTGFNWITSI